MVRQQQQKYTNAYPVMHDSMTCNINIPEGGRKYTEISDHMSH